MKLLFTNAFSKDLDKIIDGALRDRLLSVLEQLENTSSLVGIPQLKKLRGSVNAYRIRLGDYRLGFFLMEDGSLTLARFIHRKDIYRIFP